MSGAGEGGRVNDIEKAEEIAERPRQEPYHLLSNDCIQKTVRLKRECKALGIPVRVVCIGLARARLFGHWLTLPVVHGWGEVEGKRIEISCDLVVLGMAMVPNPAGKELTQKLGILDDEYGFITEMHPKFRPLETSIPGIYVAGVAQGPKDIPDSVTQASGAASKVLALFLSCEPMLEKVAKN